MARGEDTVMNTQIGDPNTSNSIIQSPRKLENGIIVKAQHVINQCKGGSGLLKVGVQCRSNWLLLKKVDNNVNIVRLEDNIKKISN